MTDIIQSKTLFFWYSVTLKTNVSQFIIYVAMQPVSLNKKRKMKEYFYFLLYYTTVYFIFYYNCRKFGLFNISNLM